MRLLHRFDTMPPWLHALLSLVSRDRTMGVEAQYLRNLYGNFVFHGPVCVVAGLYLYASAPVLGPGSFLDLWMFLFVLHHSVRALLGLFYSRRKQEPTPSEIPCWVLLSIVMHFMGALLFVPMALSVYPVLDPLAQMSLLMVVLIIVGNSAFTLAGRWAEIAVYAPPIYLSFAWATWTLDHAYAQPLSILVLMLFGLFLFQARNQHRVNLQSFGLAQRNGELASELQIKNVQLQEVAAGRSRLLATVSHDLRQPAHAMGLLCERALVESQPELLKQSLGDLNELSQSLSASLSTLMDLTRLDAGLVKAQVRPVPLGQVLLRLEAEFAGSAKNKGLALSVATSALWVRSDPVLLHGMLANLVSNAIKYTRSGRVDVTVSEQDQEITVAVHDTGMGIKPDKLDLIFQEFFRLEGADSGTEGLGLGLSIVKRYARLLGHGLLVSSQDAQGSCFSIRLPAITAVTSPAELQALSQALSISDARLQGLRVLVVDNVDLVLSSMVRTLSAWGCVVHAARSLSEAAALTQGKTLDVVISDFHLGDEEPDGLKLIQHLRGQHGGPARQLPALLMTGDVSSQLEAQAGRCQVGLLHKPVRPAVLQLRLLSLLDAPAFETSPDEVE